MRLLVLCVLIAFGSCASAGVVSDRLKATMNKYQKIELTIPESRPISSKGIMQNIQNAIGNRHVTFKIPAIPFVSNLWRSRNSTGNAAIAKNATALSNAEGQQQQEIGVSSSIISTSTAVPTKPGGHPDWCGGNILLDLNSRRELTYKSTQFPSARSVPYACSWDVKVSKNCRRGRVTMRMDGRSRLAQEDRCSKGYYRVSPFMKEAKICGRIGTVPPFQWYVDDKQPEDVTIIMKNIGLNDGNSEGMSFTLSGECLSKDGETKNKTRDVAMDNMETHSRWMYRLLMDSTTPGSRQSQVVLHTASMSLQPNSKLSAKASEKISQDFGQALASQPDLTPAESSTTSKPANKITFYSPLYLIFRKFNLI